MKTPFLQKAKHMLLSSVALGGLYAGTLAYRGYAQETEKSLKDFLELNLPSSLTQQGEDFYKNPEKEFFFYKKTYTEAVGDGSIDSKDVDKLEHILRRTLEEMQNKIYDERKLESVSSSESAAYRDLYEKRLGDLKEFQKHLEFKKEWLASDACQGKFWNYGMGLFIYAGIVDNGNVRAPEDGLEGQLPLGYKGLVEVFNDVFYKANLPTLKDIGNLRVLELREEFPAKTKINYWLGLALGLSAPLASITSLIALRMKRKKENEFSGGDGLLSAFNGLLNPALGYLCFDSVHPLVYPARLIIPPLIYSIIVMVSKPDPVSTASTPAGSPKITLPASPSSKLEEKVEQEESKPSAPRDIPNPWDIDIPTIEDKKINSERKNENIPY